MMWKRGTIRSTAACVYAAIAASIALHVLSHSLSQHGMPAARRAPLRVPTGRLLFATPRRDGFCNQLITLYQSLHCARRLNRTLVLPHMYENVRYDTRPAGPYPLGDYFDLAALRPHVDAVTVADLRIGPPLCGSVYLRNPAHCDSRLDSPAGQGCAPTPALYPDLYSPRLNVRVKSAPEYPADEPCVDDGYCNDAPHLGKYSQYHAGQGFDIFSSETFREIRALLKPSEDVLRLAKHFMASIPPCFNAVHLRRGDYDRKCSEMRSECSQYGPTAFVQDRPTVLAALNRLQHPDLPLFVSTTHEREVRDMLHGLNISLHFLGSIGLPWNMFMRRHRVDIIALASQIVASHAEGFVGNRFSSYSAEINNWRYLAGKNEMRHFF